MDGDVTHYIMLLRLHFSSVILFPGALFALGFSKDPWIRINGPKKQI